MSKRKQEMFKLDNQITWYLKDYEGEQDKQRKIIERANGDLFFVFHKEDKHDKTVRS